MVPPVPSDAAVALGAFLSNRGLTAPLGVFLVTWLSNLAGATAVYFVARRYGRRLFATSLGRRLLAPRSLAIIEREYLRFGVAGIFVSRFLPGIRAVVPPFAGLVNLSPLRTLLPTGIASAIWYGGITLLGSVIGAEWDRINYVIRGVNRTLGRPQRSGQQVDTASVPRPDRTKEAAINQQRRVHRLRCLRLNSGNA